MGIFGRFNFYRSWTFSRGTLLNRLSLVSRKSNIMKSLMKEELYCDLLSEGMPEKLFGFWTDKVKVENPKLPRTPLFFVKAVTGLV